ncbi:major facilitator family transporter [Listeria floridensis FSL S10-1187]|uniref:Major facilitator family transporter n=1 Tax=Listeria floridensis FSL S10-1187 TaxID=1265817 RepID=A0ABN0RC21_9LIST|nr:major facilitator family transporter [Listeria floridensis FSL S10-1187]
MAIGSFGLSIVATYSNYALMYRSAILALVLFLIIYFVKFGRKKETKRPVL